MFGTTSVTGMSDKIHFQCNAAKTSGLNTDLNNYIGVHWQLYRGSTAITNMGTCPKLYENFYDYY